MSLPSRTRLKSYFPVCNAYEPHLKSLELRYEIKLRVSCIEITLSPLPELTWEAGFAPGKMDCYNVSEIVRLQSWRPIMKIILPLHTIVRFEAGHSHGDRK